MAADRVPNVNRSGKFQHEHRSPTAVDDAGEFSLCLVPNVNRSGKFQHVRRGSSWMSLHAMSRTSNRSGKFQHIL